MKWASLIQCIPELCDYGDCCEPATLLGVVSVADEEKPLVLVSIAACKKHESQLTRDTKCDQCIQNIMFVCQDVPAAQHGLKH